MRRRAIAHKPSGLQSNRRLMDDAISRMLQITRRYLGLDDDD